METLTEGTPSSNWSRTELTGIDVPLVQYGEKSKISDVASETDLFDQLEIECDRMGEACALKLDNLIMAEAIANSDYNTYAGVSAFSGYTASGFTTTTTHCMSCKQILTISQHLKKMKAPKFSGGHYVGVLTPEQVYDLQQDDDWKDLNVHNKGGKAIYKNEIGEIYGVKILETTADWVEKATEGTLDATGTIYAGLFMGKGALGTVDLEGSKSAKKPSFIHVRGADKTDPLDQFQAVGWKGFFAKKLLEPKWLVTLRTKTLMPNIAASS